MTRRRAAGPLLAAVAAALAVLAFAVARPATAQEPPPETTTTTAPPESTTTTAPPESTTTTTEPPPSTTTTTTAPPAPDPGAGEEVVPEPAPGASVAVPPAPVGAGPYAGQARFADFAGRVVSIDVRAALLAASGARAALASAAAHRARLEAEVADLLDRIEEGNDRYLRSAQRLAAADLALREMAVNAYVMGGLGQQALPALLDSNDASEYLGRRALVDGLLNADRDTVERYRRARDAASDATASIAEDLASARSELQQARATEQQARLLVTATSYEVAVTSAGGSVVIHGFGFPVADPHNFVDSFGAPRMMGTAYAHWHEGTDIFAPAGTPIIAVERGVVTRMGTGLLGGIVLWLKGQSGTSYYYAHLSGYAPGINPGMLVEAGTILGYVGNTGNARTTPPHLHFEIHPNGGAAINPYPLLKVADSFVVSTPAPPAPAAPAPAPTP
jgi:murein DD-endopeptidase MepM/ murein hydrolase activator NlpD